MDVEALQARPTEFRGDAARPLGERLARRASHLVGECLGVVCGVRAAVESHQGKPAVPDPARERLRLVEEQPQPRRQLRVAEVRVLTEEEQVWRAGCPTAIGVAQEGSQGVNASLYAGCHVGVYLALAPVEKEGAVLAEGYVDPVRPMVVHLGRRLERHLAERLRQPEEPLGEQEQEQLTALAGPRETREQ